MKKRVFLSCLLYVLVVGLVSCLSENPFEELMGGASRPKGKISFSLTSETSFGNPTRVVNEAGYRNTDNYTVRLYKANTNVPLLDIMGSEIDDYMPKELEVGSYRIEAYYGNEHPFSRDEFRVEASRTFSVIADESASVVLVCSPTCGRISVDFDSEMATYYEDYSVAFGGTEAMGTTTFTWGKQDSEPYYVKLNETGETINYKIRLKTKSAYAHVDKATGESRTDAVVDGTFNLQRNCAQKLIIKPNYRSSGDGTLSLDITIDESTNDRVENIVVPLSWLEGDNQPSPQDDADVREFTVGGVTFKMIKVKAGTFMMGADGIDDYSKPIHQVTLTDDYYIGETEVTNALYKAVMGSLPYSHSITYDDYPVDYVSWRVIHTASTGFLARLNAVLSSQLNGEKFRLPTEAEWEYAARGGHKQTSSRNLYAGSNTIDDVAWYKSNSDNHKHPVAQKKANELGLYDMSGNVSEWCFDSNVEYNRRLYRGGSWDDTPLFCDVAHLRVTGETAVGETLGLRLVLPIEVVVEYDGLCPDSHHPHMIDMGAGVKWACCNVGASSPTEYGDYFAWGETTHKSTYSWSKYEWCDSEKGISLTKYCNDTSHGIVDNKTRLELGDDAARINWGNTWRMPTIDELSNLIDKCNWTWTVWNGVEGYKVVASNGNSIFLPAAGYPEPCYEGTGYYLSSSLYTSYPFYCQLINFFSGGTYIYCPARCLGGSVRPVAE